MQKMSETEAIEALRSTAIMRYEANGGVKSYLGAVMCMAVAALEEIQQYRAIGTVEQCREAVERMKEEEHE